MYNVTLKEVKKISAMQRKVSVFIIGEHHNDPWSANLLQQAIEKAREKNLNVAIGFEFPRFANGSELSQNQIIESIQDVIENNKDKEVIYNSI